MEVSNLWKCWEEEKEELGSTKDWGQWLANFTSEIVRYETNYMESL